MRNSNPAPMLFNSWTPEPVLMGIQIKSDFCAFTTPSGMHGLACVAGADLHLLAVFATRPGRGDFRRFIAQSKTFFEGVSVWEIWNPVLGAMLARYGFEPATIRDREGRELTGWGWARGYSSRPPMVDDTDNPFLQ